MDHEDSITGITFRPWENAGLSARPRAPSIRPIGERFKCVPDGRDVSGEDFT